MQDLGVGPPVFALCGRSAGPGLFLSALERPSHLWLRSFQARQGMAARHILLGLCALACLLQLGAAARGKDRWSSSSSSSSSSSCCSSSMPARARAQQAEGLGGHALVGWTEGEEGARGPSL